MNKQSDQILAIIPVTVGLIMHICLNGAYFALSDKSFASSIAALTGTMAGFLFPFIIISLITLGYSEKQSSRRTTIIMMICMLLPVVLYSGYIFGTNVISRLSGVTEKSTGAIGLAILHLVNILILLIGLLIGSIICHFGEREKGEDSI